MKKGRQSREYFAGVIDFFFRFACGEENTNKPICCPCKKCVNHRKTLASNEVYDHLITAGICLGYTCWCAHGEPLVLASSLPI
jgi:hypothetical protein